MLYEDYSPTDPHPGLTSAFEPFSRELESVPKVGAYNDGLLAVPDASSAKTLLESWSWLIGSNSRALMTTGFGDVFLWNSEGISFLEVQRGTAEFIDTDVPWFLSEFLANPEVLEKVLRKTQFRRLANLYGPLQYHKVFILEPWAMLGGTDRDEHYRAGECSVYLDLVSHSFQKNHK